jgi:hypothetical protein
LINFFRLYKGNYACLVKNEEEHIESVDCEKRISLPLLELALNYGRHNCHCARRGTNREVEHEVDLIYGLAYMSLAI